MVSLVPIAHIVAAVFSIIELGLTSYVASGYNGWSGWWTRSPDIVNFLIFNSVWSLLVLAYVGLTPLYMTRLFHKLVSLALLVITTIFWFAGAIALAVFVGAPHCGANTYCGSAQAAVAFAFFIWAIFMFLTVLDTLEAMRSRGHATKHNHAYPGA
ncbi:membrane-associating domain-containing protein [Colletotrichum phormii]|uniref:Membrane-associating domain-containing protein n=1 Tax=Colletotrichum phormii TaxID=359342 RepID=A0AAJ0EBR7_9PEZI|nr:membrane-associating domain-containing protein [Colletotrichum phormii]KAK1623912.1 membrane-associating domain-containing protein [Colletotrichum phormii]